MNVSYKNNTLTVVTDVTKAVIARGIAALEAKNDKQDTVYTVSAPVEGNNKASISIFGINTNCFIDDKAAAVIVMPVETTQADVEKKYGKALLAARKYIPVIAASATAEEIEITSLFDTEVEDAQ